VVAQSGPGRDEVEDLDGLCAERPGEGHVAADGVGACDAALFVGGAAQRQIDVLAEQPPRA
jgi:hypothetical protein